MNDISATFRREVAALPEVFTLVGSFFSGIENARELQHTVEFVVEEIFTNCVKYNPDGKSGIDVSLTRTDNQLKITLRDSDSDRFDLRTDAPPVDPSLPLEQRQPGRLGVYLVGKLMDRIDYQYADRVSTITLFKSLG